MLKTLSLRDFTVFPEATFHFGTHLNVLIGENGLGKTHALKVAYAVLAVSCRGRKESESPSPGRGYLQAALANKLRGVFKPDSLGRLARRQAGRRRCEVGCAFARKSLDLEFSFNTASRMEVSVDRLPGSWLDAVPIYLPARELLTIYPGFVSLYETTHLQFEETWRDTAVLLGAPLARGPREKTIARLVQPLERAMEGSVELDEGGRFYLRTKRTKAGRFEMHLVAEGMRKLAMIARLIATGSLIDKGFLFWDEPESNLNPRMVRLMARTILELSRSGIQVFIATHSLFLMRELDILLREEEFRDLGARFFGLHRSAAGIALEQGNSIDDIGDIAALEEELGQSDRYLESVQS